MRRLVILLTLVLLAVPIIGSSTATGVVAAPAVQGRISADGASLGGARVDVVAAGSVVATTTTTTTGRYEVQLASAGTYDLRVTPPEASPLAGTVVKSVAVGGTVAVVDVQLLTPLGSLEVTVRDGAGTPMAGALVTLRKGGSNIMISNADSTGRARLVTRPGDYELRVEAPPTPGAGIVVPSTMVIDLVDPVEVTVAGAALEVTVPTAELSVAVERDADGSIVPGALVSASVSGATMPLGEGVTATARFVAAAVGTDAGGDTAGTATLVVLPVDGVTVNVRPPTNDPFLLGNSTMVDVAGAGASTTVALPPTPVQPVSVVFKDAAGSPVEGAVLRSTLESASTDASGEATVLARQNTATLLQLTKFADHPDLPDVSRYTRTINPTAPVSFDVDAKVAEVPLRAVDTSTNPVSSARVTTDGPPIAVDGWFVRSPSRWQVTGADGRTSLRVHPDATYRFGASAPGYLRGEQTIDVVPGLSEHDIVLEPVPPPGTGGSGPQVSGRVVSSDGSPLRNITVRSVSSGSGTATTAVDGTFSFTAPPAPGLQMLRITGNQPSVFTINVPGALTVDSAAPIVLGDIVIPFETLEVRLVDQFGLGYLGSRIHTDSRGSRFPMTIGERSLSARGTSEYPRQADAPFMAGAIPGVWELDLLPGSYDVRIVEDPSGRTFLPFTFPLEAFTQVVADVDNTLQIVVPKPEGVLLVTLDGTPKVADEPLLTLSAPNARLLPLVAVPDELAGITPSISMYIDRWRCDTDEGTILVDDRDACPSETGPRLDLLDVAPGDEGLLPPFDSYPQTLTVSFRAGISTGDLPEGTSLIYAGWHTQEVLIVQQSDTAPTVSVVEDYIEGPEGSVASFTAVGTDVEGPVDISWDLDGDGVPDAFGDTVVVDLADGRSFGEITAIAVDSSGQLAYAGAGYSVQNVAPTGRFRFDGPDADIVTVSVVDVTDPSDADLDAGITVEFDLDDDPAGVFEIDGASGTIDVGGSDAGTEFPVRARLTDKDGGQRIVSGSYVVGSVNGAPALDPGGPYSVVAGSTVLLDASATDPDGDPVTITWDIPGQGSGLADPTAFDATDRDAPATNRSAPTIVDVTVTACDDPAIGQRACVDAIVEVTISAETLPPPDTDPDPGPPPDTDPDPGPGPESPAPGGPTTPDTPSGTDDGIGTRPPTADPDPAPQPIAPAPAEPAPVTPILPATGWSSLTIVGLGAIALALGVTSLGLSGSLSPSRRRSPCRGRR